MHLLFIDIYWYLPLDWEKAAPTGDNRYPQQRKIIAYYIGSYACDRREKETDLRES